jgi:parvulin-like peptidyl-prolyl isomerase
MAMSALAVAVAAGLGGCASVAERPLTAALFMPPAGSTHAAPDAVVASDVPAAAVVRPVPAEVVPVDDGADERSPKEAMILTPVPPQPFDTVRPLAPLASSPTTAPTADAAPVVVDPATPLVAPPPTPTQTPVSPAAAVAAGVYMTVGGVLAQVNDTPIYADTVLALLDKELAARARDMDPDEFRRYAAGRIVSQTQELVGDELDYSTALRTLTADDQKLAHQIAADSEQTKVKQAGGSPELARRRAAEDGLDFDEMMKRDYRQIVVSIYRRRQIEPQVQVSAQDMREFYAAYGAKLYGDKDRLQFRVIEIDPARVGGKDPRAAALAKIEAIRGKAIAGQDFAALASAENHNDGLRASGGDPGGWMDRGSYRVDAVEQALWQLPPGGVTPVVEDEGLFYVAKLEDKHEGRTRPFEDPTVQDDVLKRLTQQQMAALRDRVRDAALADAEVSAPEDRMNTALEMVMQKYVRWTGK